MRKTRPCIFIHASYMSLSVPRGEEPSEQGFGTHSGVDSRSCIRVSEKTTSPLLGE
jgi:hypothetical protein